jgi:hypothetical protein
MGYGEMGFQIKLDGMTILNLGDTILHAEEWKSLESPDILMIPIGGKSSGNTMDEEDALKALQIIKPQIVIPSTITVGLYSISVTIPLMTGYSKGRLKKWVFVVSSCKKANHLILLNPS